MWEPADLYFICVLAWIAEGLTFWKRYIRLYMDWHMEVESRQNVEWRSVMEETVEPLCRGEVIFFEWMPHGTVVDFENNEEVIFLEFLFVHFWSESAGCAWTSVRAINEAIMTVIFNRCVLYCRVHFLLQMFIWRECWKWESVTAWSWE